MKLDRAAIARLLRQPTCWLTTVSVAICISGFLALPQVLRGDDAVRAGMLREMAEGIKPESKYSFIQPLVSVPFYWVLDRLDFGVFAVTLIPLIWMALWCLVVWKVLARERSAAFAHHAIVLSIVSMLGAYLVGFGAEVFTTLGVSGGFLVGLLGRTRNGRVLAWAILVIAAANTPVMFIAVGALAVWLVLERRELRFLALPAAVFAVMVVEATWVSGDLSWTRYSRTVEHGEMALLPWGDVSGFGWPLWSGLLAVLFSFGRGVFFFVPQLWNGPSRTRDRVQHAEVTLWIACLTLVPIYAGWWAWYGGVSFGPRFFMLAVIPAAIAAATVVTNAERSLLRSTIALLALIASLWVAVAGAVFGVTTAAFATCVADGFANEALCLYTPEFSGIWAPLWARDPIGLRDVFFAGTLALVAIPTLLAILAPCRQPTARAFNRAAAHLRGPWRV